MPAQPSSAASLPERERRQALVSALTSRIRAGLHLGILRRGEPLPSARDVAREFGVDARLALAAYQTLATRGLVEIRPRSGVLVARNAEDTSAFPFDQAAWLVDALAQGVSAGVPAPDFAEQVRKSLQSRRLCALVLECNDDQLFSVSDELRRDYGLDVLALDLDVLGAAGDGQVTIDRLRELLPNTLDRVDLVVTTAPHAPSAEHLAATLGKPSLVLSMCDDLFTETGRLLREQSVYFVVTDSRFASKLRGAFSEHLGSARLRVLVHGQDALESIPMDAPAYMTRLTRRNAGKLPLLERLLPEARVFDSSSVRDVLAFVVQSNLAALTAG